MKVEIIKNKNLSKTQKNLINENRINEFGKHQKKDFSKDYESETLWFFVKDKNKIVSFGGIRPINLKYLGKEYKIGGICSTISIIKGKGYGKVMVSALINYSKKTKKTILGFTGDEMYFFEKAGLKRKPKFIKRFVYVKPNGEEVYDNDGNGIYYEGKDKFVTKVLKGKRPVYISVLHW
jgi:hypothetical protein